MPRVYRSMKIDEAGKPTLGRSATSLGVRVHTNTRHNDVHPDPQGNVPSGKGVSVAPSAQYLPVHRVYEGFADIVEGASATDPNLRIWRMGEGDFVYSLITSDLTLFPDAPKQGVVVHGEVGPSRPMLLQTYEDALADTQNAWQIDETGA